MGLSYASFAAPPSGGATMPLMILDNLRSAYNVGSVFRTAASIAPAGVLLTGICCRPPNGKLGRSSRGTHSEVPWMYLPNLMEAVRWARGSGRQLVAIENGPGAASIFESSFDLSAAFVLGNEAEGVQRRVVESADLRLYFPQTGSRDCINVSCMAAIVAAELQRRRIIG